MSATVLVDGTVYTGAFDKPVEAIAISDGKVLAVGSESECKTAGGKAAEIQDLDGATVIPGLVESHVHPIFYGLTQGWADCRSPENKNVADIQRTLQKGLENIPQSGWIRGWGYDDTLLAENRHLTREDLDVVSTDIPVVVSHISGHFLAANSVALEIARIHERTTDPAEGRIIRGPDGRSTGLMWEIGAVNLILDQIPKPDAHQLEAAALHAMSKASSRGMTSIHDLGIGLMAGKAELETWERLAAAGSLPIRINGYLRGDLAVELLQGTPDLFRRGTQGNFNLRGAKYWADGSIQGLSAALVNPYSCAETNCGELLIEPEEIYNLVQAVDRAGGQCAVHANGDHAVRVVVDALTKVLAAGGRTDARHRIEHLQMASTDDIRDLVSAGGVASIFANHIYYWGDRHRDIFIGEQRASRIDPLAEAASNGLHFGLHSDCPITPMDSLQTLWTAVTRQTSSGEILGPDQRLSPAQALHALTADSAWLIGEENTSGTLRPGMNADLAMLDQNILEIDHQKLEKIGVLGTMVDGQWVYTA